MAPRRVANAPKAVRDALARMLSMEQTEDRSNKIRAGDDRSAKLKLPDNWGTPENVRLFLKEFPDLDLYGEELLLRIFERLQEHEVGQAIFANPNLPFRHYAQGSRITAWIHTGSTYEFNFDWLSKTNIDWLFWSDNVLAPSCLGELGETKDFLTRLLTNAMVDMNLFSLDTAAQALARYRARFPHHHHHHVEGTVDDLADLLISDIFNFFLLDEGTGHAILKSSPGGLLNPADRQIQANARNGSSSFLNSGNFSRASNSLKKYLLEMRNAQRSFGETNLAPGSGAWLSVQHYQWHSGHIVELMMDYLKQQGYAIGAVVEELALLRKIQQGLGLPEFKTPLDAIL